MDSVLWPDGVNKSHQNSVVRSQVTTHEATTLFSMFFLESSQRSHIEHSQIRICNGWNIYRIFSKVYITYMLHYSIGYWVL